MFAPGGFTGSLSQVVAAHEMAYFRASSQKFVLYLHENNHLQDFTIQKNEARRLYKDFRKEHKTQLNFGCIFHHSLNLLKRTEDLSILVFKKNKIERLLKEKSKIDLLLKKGFVRKNTLVSHSLSFNSNKRSEENIVTQKECKLCNVQFKNKENYEEHLNESRHAFFEQFSSAAKPPNAKLSNLQFTINDSPILDNIIARKSVPQTVHLSIKNVAEKSVKISAIQFKTIKEIEFSPSVPTTLAPSTVTQYALTVHCIEDGIVDFPILFTVNFENNIQHHPVQLVFHVHDESLDDLHPMEPYKRQSRAVFKEYIEHIDVGERPNIFPQMKMKVPLKPYHLPIDIAIVLNAGLKPFEGITKAQQTQLTYIKNLLNVENKQQCLQPGNYSKLLDLLLHIEEHQLSKDIRDYDREDQILKRTGDLLELEVPGLAEHRPSLILADSVFVREHKNSTTRYEGFVHRVKETSVLLKFSKNFMDTVYVKGKKFYVNFTFNRYPLKVEHQAVDFAQRDNIAHLLFPRTITTAPLSQSDISWINRDIVNNAEQQQAVRAILNRTAMPAPYLIFGPPGTGKTMTVVEAVMQIYKLTKYNVLICTPSNNAANEVTKRLVATLPTTDLFRFIAPSFPYGLIPNEIRKFSNYKNGNYYQAMMDELSKYRVVITTLIFAAKLVNSGCPTGHFGYVFVDESGQATETETLIPIARILSGGTTRGSFAGQIVLAGDHRQLGPIIHSTLALEYGFGISMLERLMSTCESYKKDNSNKYNANAVTKLLKNYRSHPTIMQKSSELFYENELQTAGDHLINAAIGWEGLPNPKFPLIFHSVMGKDLREKNSPSYFNLQEIQTVLFYLESLLGSKMQGIIIKEEHIGVVSPYKKQIEKIKQACRNKKYNDKLMVGSVEQIQGQERLIIIISTVRSKTDFLKFDHKFHLGFLDNPKRFNVAITRAKALLVVIGNPNILQYDPHWRTLITYCKENGAMAGEKFDFSTDDEIQKTAEALQNMSLIAETTVEEVPSFARGNI